MTQSNTYLVIPGLLKPGELALIDSLLETARFENGSSTATDTAKAVKNNLQMPGEGSAEKQQIDAIFFHAITQSPLLQAALTPTRVLPPIISKYQPGMHYGYHVDSPLMSNPQTGAIRADVAMTLFLSDPESYVGGELSLMTQANEQRYKLAKGDAIVYPCTQVHAVLPVTSGVRLAAVTWLQCAVRDQMKREILFQLKSAQSLTERKDPGSAENLVLLQAYANLMRMWAEL